MSQPQPQPEPVPVIEMICTECGEMVVVHDPVALVRALHLLNECSTRSLLAPQA